MAKEKGVPPFSSYNEDKEASPEQEFPNMAEKGWLREHLSKTTITVILGSILTGIITLFSPAAQEFAKSIPGRIATGYYWLGEPVETYRWLYWVLVLVAAGVVCILGLVWISVLRSPKDQPYMAYKADNFFGINWRWEWAKDGGIDWATMQAYCPRCDRFLFHTETLGYGTTFRCQGCGIEIPCEGKSHHGVMNALLCEIDHLRRSGAWEQRVAAKQTAS